jgi:hypothetical protein
MKILVCLTGAVIFLISCSFGQVDFLLNKTVQFPNWILTKINSKTYGLNDALTIQTERYLKRLEKKEEKIQERWVYLNCRNDLSLEDLRHCTN